MSWRRRQAGMTLVELIIGMAVTTIVLGGMVAIVFTLNNSYNAWVGRVSNASNGEVLAAAIQADAHRFVACSATAVELDFCPVSGTTPAVAYRTQGPAPYSVTRNAGVSRQLMVRGLAAAPAFHVDCDGGSNLTSGYVEVVGISGLGRLRVYFRSPLGACRET